MIGIKIITNKIRVLSGGEKEGVVTMSEATKRVIEYLHKENEELKAKCNALEKALEKACGVMTNRVNINSGDGSPTLRFTKEQWKEWCLHEHD